MVFARIGIAYAVLALATAFYPSFSGRLPVPDSGPVPPGRTRGASTFRNDELSDVTTQFVPWTKAVADSYRAGRLPLRFAANACGMPLWANPQAQAVTPTTLFAILLPVPWAFAAAAAAKLWLAASGTFLLLRARGVTRSAAFWGGLAYGFSLQLTTWIRYPDTWPAALLPWVLVALDRLARGWRGGFPATVAAVFLLLLGGYPETELYVAIGGAAYFSAVLAHERVPPAWRARRAGRAIAASLLALGLTGAYTLPAALALARSQRSAQIARAVASSHPHLAATDFLRPPIYWDVMRFWIVPEAQGNPRDGDKFGPYSFAGRSSGYAGILIVAFALSTFLWRRAPRGVVWARRALVGIALYVLAYPPLAALLQSTPGARAVAASLTTNRACCLLVLLASLLAAFELDRLREKGRAWPTRVALGVVLLTAGLVFREFLGRPERPTMTLSSWRAVSFLLPALLLCGALALLAGGVVGRRRRALAVLLVAGTAVDLLRIGARFDPGTRPADYFPETETVRRLQEAARGGRFATPELAMTGVAYMYGLEDVRAHSVVVPAAYDAVLRATAGFTGSTEYPARLTRWDAPFLDFLNVRGRLTGEVVSRSPAPMPAAFPRRLVAIKSDAEILDRLGRETDFAGTAYAAAGGETFSGAATILAVARPRPEETRVRVRTDAPRVLVVPETNDGGWTAFAGGRRLPVFTANGAFLAIRVPAGESEILCRYRPPGFAAGLAISGTTALLAALLAARRLRRGARSSWRSSAGAEALRPEP